jgi:hypothetical protein
VAVSGSRTWRKKWSTRVWKDLDEQLERLRPGDTFTLRHGGAGYGADQIAHEWFVARVDGGHAIHMVEEVVAADWANCVQEPYRDVTGKLIKACPTDPGHRRERKRGRGEGETYCPWRGQLRNPDVVVHPDHPVDCFLAYVVNDSAGTTRAIEYARRYQLNRVERYFYPGRKPKASPAERDDRGPGGGDGDGSHPGGGVHNVELPGTE